MNYSFFTLEKKVLAVRPGIGNAYPANKVIKLNETSVTNTSFAEILEQLAKYIEEGVPKISIEGEGDVDSTFYGDNNGVILIGTGLYKNLYDPEPGHNHGVQIINEPLTYLRNNKFDEAWNNIQDNVFEWGLNGATRGGTVGIYTFKQNANSFTAQGVFDSTGKTVTGDNIFNFSGLSENSLYNKGEWPDMAVFDASFDMDYTGTDTDTDTDYPIMKAEMLRAYASLCTVMGF